MENAFLTTLTTTEVKQLLRDELKGFFSEFDPKYVPSPPCAQQSEDKVLDILGLAKYLNCSINTIHNLKKDGSIPFYRLGRKVYFKKIEIDKIARVDRFIERIMAQPI